ncbi:ABC transporter permease [Muricauda sp. CAU 1633]|uniref:ABC transporter permease n=1 Tax=Allomuricauda sp. CAU 1633 TaxID=2816036 RepID=UPI001A8D5C0A|nr:ABC transporter permease [Muricauda sp. CAU 1633]MBO0323743.1 ABC transporter permease [Muricauda sp. CAU 1633]
MKQSITATKVNDIKWAGVVKSLLSKLKVKTPKLEFKTVFKKFIIPIISILLFIGLWHMGAKALYNIEADYKIQKALTDQGQEAADAMEACILSGDISCQPNTLPSPDQVWDSFNTLIADHKKISADKLEFKEKTVAINEKRKAEGKDPITYTGRPSFVDQIFTSLETVFAGFLLALIIAVPIGIIIGLSETLRNSFNWLIQVFKPVSPVVWLLLVFMIVKTMTKDSNQDSAFIISFISVGLCSMWATLVNTAMGVSSVDKDYINVAKVLKLGPFQKVFKVILPSSLPLIFTGLRITLSVAWMVLIAIELLAQSPGLGSFVWEEFQNGANDSNSKIIVAMFIIGIIGFLLDRIMLVIQNMVSFNKNATA